MPFRPLLPLILLIALSACGDVETDRSSGVPADRQLASVRDAEREKLLLAEAVGQNPDNLYEYGAFLRSDAASNLDDLRVGLEWIRKAAEAGSTKAMAHYGTVHLFGGCDVKPSEWFQKSVAQCNFEPYREAGRGLLVPEPKVGVVWLEKAAELGDAESAWNLGTHYQAEKDEKMASKWYTVAAEMGHVSAQNNLGVNYLDGRGIPQNDVEAKRWFRVAAERGNAIAQRHLAQVYEAGRGGAVDLTQAYYWYSLAAVNWPDASKERDEIRKRLSSDQIAAVQRLTLKWNPAGDFEEAKIRAGFAPSPVQRGKNSPEAERRTVSEGDGLVIADADLLDSPGGKFVHSIKAGSAVTLLSARPVSGAHEIIDIESGHFGWVDQSKLRIDLPRQQEAQPSPFRATPTGVDGQPRVEVKNEADTTIWLRVAGNTRSIAPAGSISLEIPEGKHRFFAWAPGVLPATGEDAFKRGMIYDWVFWIEQSKGAGARRRKR